METQLQVEMAVVGSVMVEREEKGALYRRKVAFDIRVLLGKYLKCIKIYMVMSCEEMERE